MWVQLLFPYYWSGKTHSLIIVTQSTESIKKAHSWTHGTTHVCQAYQALDFISMKLRGGSHYFTIWS